MLVSYARISKNDELQILDLQKKYSTCIKRCTLLHLRKLAITQQTFY